MNFLNICDYLLWSLYLDANEFTSQTIQKSKLEGISFKPEHIDYSNDFTEKTV